MSMNDLERFLGELQTNSDMKREFEGLSDDPTGWVRWAETKGYHFTPEDAEGLSASRDAEISDDDLEKVAGGWCGNELTVT
jgi:predicted ribosomally synthesized peptide with nif11-like leader